MHTVLIFLRLLHIVLGAFWVGAVLFVSLWLQPAIRDAGPDGMKVMAGIGKRHYMTVAPLAAILTLLSGLTLYWRVSGGMQAVWIGSRMGIAFTAGGAAAIVGFGFGMLVLRPAMMRIMALGPAAQQMPEGPQRAAALAELQRLRQRAGIGGNLVTGLLLFALCAMAVARYL
jgi:uncharacterized membrane protein